MIETQAFKKWFGKSVAKSKGKPIPLYHGSHKFFTSIDPGTFGRGHDAYGSGFYLTTDPGNAKSYGSNVLKVYARIEKPMTPEMTKPLTRIQIQRLIVSAPDYKDSLSNFGDWSYYGLARVMKETIDQYDELPAYDAFQVIQNDFWKSEIAKFLKTMIKVTGYDGVVVNATNDIQYYIVFTPNQVKLTSNDGTWSKEDDDMRRNPVRKNPTPPAKLVLNSYNDEDDDGSNEKDVDAVWKIQSTSGIRITRGKSLVVIAKIGRKVVGGGFYGVSPGYGVGSPAEASFDIVVDEKQRGKGIGEALTKYLVKLYKQDTKCYDDDIALNLEVVNPIMYKVLDKFGYVMVKEYGKVYYRDPEAPEIK